jgi:hypothetical protein
LARLDQGALLDVIFAELDDKIRTAVESSGQ